MAEGEREKPPGHHSWLPLRGRVDVFGATAGHVATGAWYAAAIPTATALRTNRLVADPGPQTPALSRARSASPSQEGAAPHGLSRAWFHPRDPQ
jgi:hypothetical protein